MSYGAKWQPQLVGGLCGVFITKELCQLEEEPHFTMLRFASTLYPLLLPCSKKEQDLSLKAVYKSREQPHKVTHRLPLSLSPQRPQGRFTI